MITIALYFCCVAQPIDKIYDGQMYDYLYPIEIEDYQAIEIFRFSDVLLFLINFVELWGVNNSLISTVAPQ